MKSTSDRRISILNYLSKHKRTTSELLAIEFDVSTRTIWRDITVLTCNYPIFTTIGRNGGIYLDDDFRIGKSYLSENQVKVIKDIISTIDNENEKAILQSILMDFSNKKGDL